MAQTPPIDAPPIAWAPFEPATFARAKAEGRFVVFDGAAEWCHWCHVMEATTYADPRVRALVAAKFVAIKVDVDTRPDLAERYGDYGWPATVLFGPDGDERGKYRGYLAPREFLEILEEVVASTGGPGEPSGEPAAPSAPLDGDALAWVASFAQAELDEYYDPEHAGWGRAQKTPLADDNAWALVRAGKGLGEASKVARAQAIASLDAQAKLLDPVWGGLCQYSAARDWDHPHFEKLLPYEAGAIDNYARAYALTGEARFLARAKQVEGYVAAFLSSPEGGFYASQDADLNAHEPTKRFVDGNDYYRLDDAGRRALGVPRVDTHEYAHENGLAIEAYVTLYEVTKEAAYLARAQRAADRILATHAVKNAKGSPSGGVRHDADLPGGNGGAETVLYLADNAAFGLGLAEATGDPKRKQQAIAIATVLLAELHDDARGGAANGTADAVPGGARNGAAPGTRGEASGGFFAHTKDEDAFGVFAARRKPVEDDVLAIRFLARVAALDPAHAKEYARAVADTWPFVANPAAIKHRGRMLGDLLLAIEETRALRGAK